MSVCDCVCDCVTEHNCLLRPNIPEPRSRNINTRLVSDLPLTLGGARVRLCVCVCVCRDTHTHLPKSKKNCANLKSAKKKLLRRLLLPACLSDCLPSVFYPFIPTPRPLWCHLESFLSWNEPELDNVPEGLYLVVIYRGNSITQLFFYRKLAVFWPKMTVFSVRGVTSGIKQFFLQYLMLGEFDLG